MYNVYFEFINSKVSLSASFEILKNLVKITIDRC